MFLNVKSATGGWQSIEIEIGEGGRLFGGWKGRGSMWIDVDRCTFEMAVCTGLCAGLKLLMLLMLLRHVATSQGRQAGFWAGQGPSTNSSKSERVVEFGLPNAAKVNPNEGDEAALVGTLIVACNWWTEMEKTLRERQRQQRSNSKKCEGLGSCNIDNEVW